MDVLNHRDNGYNESATETVGITDDWMTAASVDLHAEEDGRCHEVYIINIDPVYADRLCIYACGRPPL